MLRNKKAARQHGRRILAISDQGYVWKYGLTLAQTIEDERAKAWLWRYNRDWEQARVAGELD